MPSTTRSASSSSSSHKQEVHPVLDEQFLPRIVAVFYSIFHPTEGAKVVYQVPEGIISTSSQQQTDSSSSSSSNNGQEKEIPECGTRQTPIFDFKSVSEFIIPKAPLCGRLISYSIASPNGQSYKILSLPVILLDQAKYPRKSFIFNVAFVFDGRADTRAYEPIVRKCARELRDLETSNSFLSQSQFRMYWVIEQLFEDLNSYCESFVALPEAPHTKYVNDVLKTAGDHSKQVLYPTEGFRRAMPGTPSSPFYNGNKQSSDSKEGQNTKAQTSLSIDRESLREVQEGASSSSIPPLTIGDPTIPTESSRLGNRRESNEHQSVAAAAAASSPTRGDSKDNTTNTNRKSSAGSVIGSPNARPGMGRSKTFADLAVSETTVNALSGNVSLLKTAKDTVETSVPEPLSMSRQHSTESSALTVTGEPEQPNSSLTRGDQEMERGLSESIMSLRRVGVPQNGQNPHSLRGGVGDSVGAVPPAAMLAPGKREPPHGLGRTVRDAINLKLFPTYPNPKDINDWDVPVTLLDLRKRMTGNWDLTMCKVLPFIDGINHTKRIAQLADADLELTRQCIEHLLYYRCIITTDTFQFTNMYTVRPSIAVMAEDEIMMVECASYVTKRGYPSPTWPKLLSLYSSLRPASTVNEWIEENDVEGLGIDVRRFVSFGVIKGFLRRVHRYPVLLPDETSPLIKANLQRDKISPSVLRDQSNSRSREREGDASLIAHSQTPISPELGVDVFSLRRGRHGPRQLSENESLKTGGTATSVVSGTSTGRRRKAEHQTHRKTRATVMDVANVALEAAAAAKDQERQASYQAPSGRVSIRTPLPRGGSSSTIRPVPTTSGSKESDDQHSPAGVRIGRASRIEVPAGFIDLLDGTHPDDEFCVRFGLSWNEVLAILIMIGKQPNFEGRSATNRHVRLPEQEEEGSTAAAATSGWGTAGASVAGEGDESGIAGLSGFYSSATTISNRRRSIGMSLPKYRSQQSHQTGGGPTQSDFSRYASTGDGVSTWGRISGIQSSSLSVEDYSQVDRESVARGDLGRIKIIIK